MLSYMTQSLITIICYNDYSEHIKLTQYKNSLNMPD